MPDLAFDRHPIVRVAHGLVRVYTLAFQGLRIETPCPIPRNGPAIVICNHVSGLDPFLIQSTCSRIIRWFIAKEYYDLPHTRPLAERLGYIPVARKGRDAASLKAGLRALAAGQVVGVFPEGRINDGPALMPFQPGVAMLALRGEATVIPAFVDVPRYNGMLYPFLDPQMTRIRFGEPFIASGDIHAATADMAARVAALERTAPRYSRGPRGFRSSAQVRVQ